MGERKTRVGRVISNKMDKTAVVAVEIRRQHPLYKKVVTHRTKFKVHDPANSARVGDLVKIEETRPLSKEKRWRLVETLAQGKVAEALPQDVTA